MKYDNHIVKNPRDCYKQTILDKEQKNKRKSGKKKHKTSWGRKKGRRI